MKHVNGRHIYHTTLIALTGFTILAAFYLMWLSSDGTVFRPPLVLDGDTMQTTKTEYRRGETVEGVIDFCKNRAIRGTIQWQLIDTIIRFYPARPVSVPQGCYRGKAATIEAIPMEVLPGEYRFKGIVKYEINPLSTVNIPLKTNTFRVTE